MVKIFAFLELKQNLAFFKGLIILIWILSSVFWSPFEVRAQTPYSNSNIKRLTHTLKGQVRFPSISEDGKHIVFIWERKHEEIENNPNMICSNCGDSNWVQEY